MVGGSQAQPVSEPQAAHASEIKRVAVGNSSAFAPITAGRRAAGAGMLAPASYEVSGTPANGQ